MKYIVWALLWPLMFLIGLIGRILSPIAAMFIVRAPRLDTVKRRGKQILLLERDSLVWWLTWFDTDDNATDEWWYGMYSKPNWTQADYDNSILIRWYCRMRWLQRNSMYTFNRQFFGIAKNSPLAWQYKVDVPLWFGYYNSINIGFKTHKGFNRLMYAGRILGIRKYK
jgi:hypothetical protein